MSEMSGYATRSQAAEGGPSAAKPATRRRRPHPARRARRIVGAAGMSGMLLMTGYMTLNSAQGASADSVTAGTSTTKSVVATLKSGAATAATPAATANSTSKTS